MDFATSILGDIVITLGLYMIPICVYRVFFCHKPLEKKSALITTAVFGVIMFFVMSFIKYWLTEKTATPAPAFIWSAVNYFILTHKSLLDDTTNTIPTETKEESSISVAEDAEECSQENSSNGTVPEEPTVTDPLPEKSRTFEEEDKPAAEEHKALTLKASSSDKEKVLLNIKVPSAKVLRILNIVIIIVLTVAVIALSIAFPRALKKVNKDAYDRGYNDGYNIGYAQGEYHQKYFGTSQSYQSDSNIQSTDEEHSETIDERIARVQREYGN